MKLAVSLLAFLTVAVHGYATSIVYDPINHGTNIANQIQNVIIWAETEVQAAETQINTLNTYENQIVQLARMGDPSALRNLPVIGSVESLLVTSQQALAEYKQLQYLTSPQYLEGQMDSIKSAYNLQNWTTPYPLNYQFPSANYGVAQSAQQQLVTLEQQRKTLEGQRDSAMQLLQSASDNAQVQKYHGSLTAVNGALAEVAAREQALMHQVGLQQQQLQAGQAVAQQQQREQVGNSFQQGINSTLQTMSQAGANFGTTPRWSSIAP